MSDFADTIREFTVGARRLRYFSLPRLGVQVDRDLSRLPYCVRILLEGLLRQAGRAGFSAAHVRQLAAWEHDRGSDEFPFLPGRVLLQDFTGVPCVVDLAALRGALARLGRDPSAIEPLIPVDLVIDHSVQLDKAGAPGALEANVAREFERNRERYEFLRWGQQAFSRLRVLPPGLGICHQVNMEYLAGVVRVETDAEGRETASPDTLVGTDSHTVMINALGVLGWGVGGIEAEAAMLGQPIPLLPPRVTGVRLVGRLPPPATATDLALVVTQRLRQKDVVERFVEFFGPALDDLGVADRAPVANMAPEYGATSGFFPVDAATLRYLAETGRTAEQIEIVEQYCRSQGLWRGDGAPEPAYADVLEIDLSDVRAGVAGPRRPHDRIELPDVGRQFREALTAPADRKGFAVEAGRAADAEPAGAKGTLGHGAVVIASITSCTNTSNPALLLTAGLVARRAVERGLRVPPWVKTSFAPGSRAATTFLRKAGLLDALERLGFHAAAYGCATCIGNSGPLDAEVADAIRRGRLVAAAVLSGNRNFEGRIHPLTRANYLCSPPLVVAYALRGTVNADLANEPVGHDPQGRPVLLRDLWPSPQDLAALLPLAADPEDYRRAYGRIDAIAPEWNALPESRSAVFAWDPASTYIREPTFFDGFETAPRPVPDLVDAAVLAVFGDFITTDHLSPAGSIPADSPAGRYLVSRGVAPADFNSYGARRGNHEVMIRGTFGNIRIRNRMVDREGGWTAVPPDGEIVPIYDAALRYRERGVPLVVLAGRLYGAGSSRDWAAKGPALLGVRAVIAESYERIHRSNLAEMGVLPLQFPSGANAERLGLTGAERITIRGLADLKPGVAVAVEVRSPDGRASTFDATVRLDTPIEVEYFRHGGVLPYVLREYARR
jgi:aconitate hydratase